MRNIFFFEDVHITYKKKKHYIIINNNKKLSNIENNKIRIEGIATSIRQYTEMNGKEID